MLIIGHRGAKGEAKGNTIDSVRRAIDSGVDMVEFDVMTTKDGIPVLYHGLRLTSWGRKQLPEKLTFEELVNRKPNIATLKEALALCGNTMLNVDIKSYNVKPILEMIQLKMGKDAMLERVIISSHLIKTLRRVRHFSPEIRIAAYSGFNPLSWIFYHFQVRLFAVGMTKKLRIFIQPLAHLMGLKTYVFSVNQKSLLRKYEKLGTWAVITNQPSKIIDKKH